jgi:hypothetical protein
MIDSKIAAAIKEERVRIARLGGQARAKNLSPQDRKRIATRASKAAAVARKKKGKQKKNTTQK